MTLNDLERQKRGFYGFFGDFGLRNTFQERIAPKPIIEIDMDKLRMKFSALNLDFDGPSLDFLDSRKLVHDGIYSNSCCSTDLQSHPRSMIFILPERAYVISY